MKKILFLALGLVITAFVLSNLSILSDLSYLNNPKQKSPQLSKKPILRAALIADSHNENDLLEKALKQAAGAGVNFIIGLGDYTAVGTREELNAAKTVFENARLPYFTTAGDHDLWDSRDKGKEPLANYSQIFGESTHIFERENVLFVILDNSDIYNGIDPESWRLLEGLLSESAWQIDENSENFKFQISNFKLAQPKLRFVFAHKTPFHPESGHIMGGGNSKVAVQAQKLLNLLESAHVDGFFSGDIHFFAQFSTSGNSQADSVKITTIGAVAKERNFQGPRFGILTIYDDYSWQVENVEIR